jgi:G3E family GTPase
VTAIPIHFFTGFLGSGKTTLIGSLLADSGGRRIGLVLNDFGSVCIDERLVDAEKPVRLASLAGGQIFCSCLAGNFVRTVRSFGDLSLDALLVEASGLAKPNALRSIVDEIEREESGTLVYGSTSCVVDATAFELLLPVVNVLAEQVSYSDRVFLTKLDLAGAGAAGHLCSLVDRIAPGKVVVPVDGRKIGWDDLQLTGKSREGTAPSGYSTWGAFGRPVSGTIEFVGEPTVSDLTGYLDRIRWQVLRVKGYVATVDRGVVFCEVAAGKVRVGEREPDAVSPVLTVIVGPDSLLRSGADGSALARIRWD